MTNTTATKLLSGALALIITGTTFAETAHAGEVSMEVSVEELTSEEGMERVRERARIIARRACGDYVRYNQYSNYRECRASIEEQLLAATRREFALRD